MRVRECVWLCLSNIICVVGATLNGWRILRRTHLLVLLVCVLCTKMMKKSTKILFRGRIFTNPFNFIMRANQANTFIISVFSSFSISFLIAFSGFRLSRKFVHRLCVSVKIKMKEICLERIEIGWLPNQEMHTRIFSGQGNAHTHFVIFRFVCNNCFVSSHFFFRFHSLSCLALPCFAVNWIECV